MDRILKKSRIATIISDAGLLKYAKPFVIDHLTDGIVKMPEFLREAVNSMQNTMDLLVIKGSRDWKELKNLVAPDVDVEDDEIEELEEDEYDEQNGENE